MLLLTFCWKNISYLFFHCFFYIILENPAPPSLKFSSPTTNSPMKRSSHTWALPQWALSRHFGTTESIRSPLGKNKQTNNTHPWSVFWQKIRNPTFLLIGAWNFYSTVLWYVEFDGVIFVKVVRLLGGVFSLFSKMRQFSQARSFWCVRLILMKLIYLNSAFKSNSFDVTIGIKIIFFRVRLLLSRVTPYYS